MTEEVMKHDEVLDDNSRTGRTACVFRRGGWSVVGGLTDCDADVFVSCQVINDWRRHVSSSEQQNLFVFLSESKPRLLTLPRAPNNMPRSLSAKPSL